jgi:type VI secretion system protein ImpM
VPAVLLSRREPGEARSGFFGKLPARRDFVTGNLSRAVTERWHDWLEDGLVRSRELIGDGWIDAYLNQPVWRFALSGGLCGDGALAGVMIPNIDKVGRYFPLILATVLPAGTGPAVVSVALADWYGAAEALALSSLEAAFVFETFEGQVEALAVAVPPAGVATEPGEETAALRMGRSRGWHASAAPGGRPDLLYARLLDRALAAGGRGKGYSLWWTAGSDCIPPELVVHEGMPDAIAFTALLDGRWDERGWGQQPDLRVGGEWANDTGEQ